MRATRRLFGAVFVLSLLVVPGAHAQEQTRPKAAAVLDLINHARIDAGLSPVARSVELDTAAQGHSADMVQHRYLDHTGFDGSEPQDRADQAGYHVPPNTGWIVVEVISAISADPSGPVQWWLGDRVHRRVLMNPRWREVGVGYAEGGDYGNYWTADFGCRPGVLPTVVVDGTSFASTEECGDPNYAPAPPTPTAMPTVSVLTPTPRPN